MTDSPEPPAGAPRLPRDAAVRFIVALGFVSLFADMTYEGARSVIGPFLAVMGATAAQVGFIAGLGEMAAASLRFFSGRFADRSRAYWPLTFLGYGLNIIVVPALAFAGSWQAAALLVVAERTGKSVRGPARDVLLSGATAEVGHGWGFGLHAAMDQAGAVLGPLLVVFAVSRAHRFAPAFLMLAAPAVAAVIALVLARAQRPAAPAAPAPEPAAQTPGLFWTYAAAAGLLALGFADFSLLAYHIEKAALMPAAMIPLAYAGAMAVNGITALLFGRLFDRIGLLALVAGIVVSALALPLGFLGGPALVAVGIGCWATGLGAQDGVLRAGIARITTVSKRGAAFGAFNGVFGIAWFAGSVTMGLLYERSRVALVIFGLAAHAAAALVFLYLRRRLPAPAKK